MIVRSGDENGGFRRVSQIAPNPGEGLLTEPTPAVQPPRREQLFMPPFETFNGREGGNVNHRVAATRSSRQLEAVDVDVVLRRAMLCLWLDAVPMAMHGYRSTSHEPPAFEPDDRDDNG